MKTTIEIGTAKANPGTIEEGKMHARYKQCWSVLPIRSAGSW